MITKLYKGYVRTDGKITKEKIKGRDDFSTLDEVEEFSSYAGVLEDNVVLIDVDNKVDSDIVYDIVKGENLKCRVLESTRGKHFLFEKGSLERNRTGAFLGIGIQSDVKLGSRNSYESLKIDGVPREIIYNTGEYESIPKYLESVGSGYNFSQLEEGEGRNQKFFNYILMLQSEGWANDDIKECLRIINTYVLSEPLSESEFKTVTRDEAFMKPNFFVKKRFEFFKFAKYLLNNRNIIKINGQLSVYDNGLYISDKKAVEREMIDIIPTLNATQRTEVLKYLDVAIEKDTPVADERFIGFKNGVLDIATGDFLEHSPNIVLQNLIGWDYVQGSYDKTVDTVLNNVSCGDAGVRQLLEEMIGYCFYRKNHLRKTFFLVGDKKNGKSTYLTMLQNLLGRNNISSLDLRDLDERFMTAQLHGKLANIGDDIEEDFISRTATFKKIATGNRLIVENKGDDPFEFEPYCKMIFSVNNPPRIKDPTGAVQSRLLMIPFNATFDENTEDFDPFIGEKLRKTGAMEYLVQLGIKGLKRILLNGEFSKSEASDNLGSEYERINNPILDFIDDTGIDGIINESTDEVYRRYNVFCVQNNLRAMGKPMFVREINDKMGTDVKRKQVDGVRYKYFYKVGK